MADITTLDHGFVEESEKVNWRGDQATAPIPQSVYKTSSVQLGRLGSRKIVGDTTYKYAVAGGAVAAGEYVEGNAEARLLVTAGGTNPAGGKIFTWYAATSQVKNLWADGLLWAQSGTLANLGYTYRVKSHAAITTTTNGDLTLYDALAKQPNVTDKWSLLANPYSNVIQGSAGVEAPVGVAAISATSGDYFWLATWGPSAVKNATGAKTGMAIVANATGQVIGLVQSNTVNGLAIMGYNMHIYTASHFGMTWLTISP